jgi:hemerythrin superfamily protein
MPTTPSKSADTPGEDAIALLTADHKSVKQLFNQFDALKESTDSDGQKADLVESICVALTIHAQIEEEIFYPAVRKAIDDDDLMDEADVEHDEVKALIAQLETMEPGDDHYDAKVTVLGEDIDHHVKEEEGEMFPKARKADIDGVALGKRMASRKTELKAEMALQNNSTELRQTTTAGNGGKKSSRSARTARPAAKR